MNIDKRAMIIVGAGSQVGMPLVLRLTHTREVEFRILEHADLDITNEGETREKIGELKNELAGYDTILVNFAGCVEVDAIEQEPKKSIAEAVHVNGARNIAKVCAEYDIRPFHISTGYVAGAKEPFSEYEYALRDGEEKKMSPVGAYAQSKERGEKAFVDEAVSGCIIRIDTPFGPPLGGRKENLVHVIKKRLEADEMVSGIADRLISLTYTPDLGNIILRHAWDERVISKGRGVRVLHVVNGDPTTPFELALHVCEILRKPESLVEPVTVEEYEKKIRKNDPERIIAPRPKSSGLLNTTSIIEVPSWQCQTSHYILDWLAQVE